MKSDKFKYRFFKGEENCPFNQDEDYSRFAFWREEKMHHDLDAAQKQYFLELFTEALENGDLKDSLSNDDFTKEERSILFYADLHCERFDPYGYELVDWPSYFAS